MSPAKSYKTPATDFVKRTGMSDVIENHIRTMFTTELPKEVPHSLMHCVNDA